MQYYEYADWVEWPEDDVREYAREIADHHSLPGAQAQYLETEMAKRAGYWPQRKPPFGPFKMGEELEALFRSLGKGDEEVFAENQRFNRWSAPEKFAAESRWDAVGSGLTARRSRRIIHETRAFRRERKRAERHRTKRPFTAMNTTIVNRVTDALWESGAYLIEPGMWLTLKVNDAPLEGLAWYARHVEEAYRNARRQADLGNVEGALWHAFRAGTFVAEMEIRLAHGRLYEKYQSVSAAQRGAAQSRKTISDELRRETYWRYRNEGNKRVEAGRLAGLELGLSEASIRSAFPDAKYPTE